MLLTLLGVHAAAFAALLLLTRTDVQRVDDAGAWVARSIPAATPERVSV